MHCAGEEEEWGVRGGNGKEKERERKGDKIVGGGVYRREKLMDKGIV